MEPATIYKDQYPLLLQQLEKLPTSMDLIGTIPSDDNKFLCVVGSRKFSSYGREACNRLIEGLRGYPIVIVSGLAIGIDSISHEAALRTQLKTVAFPGSGLSESVIYPRNHLHLARRIVDAGGALISPFKRDQIGIEWTFPVRNALMAGMSHATLIIEGGEKSGTLITAGNTLEFNRELLVVPGSIFSDLSYGPHKLIRDGATPITSSRDILVALGLMQDMADDQPIFLPIDELTVSPEEKRILKLLISPVQRDELIRRLAMPIPAANTILANLELKGIIAEVGNNLVRKM